MVVPTQGCYQPHPRSATIHPCPHTEACMRDANAVQNLQGYQCAIRGVLDSAEIDARPFTALQCSKGYWGPFCRWVHLRLPRCIWWDEDVVACGSSVVIMFCRVQCGGAWEGNKDVRGVCRASNHSAQGFVASEQHKQKNQDK
jgi:hypothetical protein